MCVLCLNYSLQFLLMTDRQFIEGIINKDQKCFKEFVDLYQPLVVNTCNSFLHCKKDAEDVAQEVFVEAYLSIEKFVGKSKLSTWLYRISVNKSLNYIRDNKKRSIVKNIGTFFSGGKNSAFQIEDESSQLAYNNDGEILDEKIALLHKSINTLPKNQRIAFTLSKFDELSYIQISEIMNLSLPAVEGLIHRAKMNVQKEIINFYKKK